LIQIDQIGHEPVDEEEQCNDAEVHITTNVLIASEWAEPRFGTTKYL